MSTGENTRGPQARHAATSAACRFAADESGWTDLHHAAVWNPPDLARRLLAAGAPVDARLRHGQQTDETSPAGA